MPPLELNPFIRPSAQKKEPEVKLVGKFLGPDAEKIFEKFDKSKKSDQPPDLYPNIEEHELTEQEKLLMQANGLEREGDDLFKRYSAMVEQIEDNHTKFELLIDFAEALTKAGRNPKQTVDKALSLRQFSFVEREVGLQIIRVLTDAKLSEDAASRIEAMFPEDVATRSEAYAYTGSFERALELAKDLPPENKSGSLIYIASEKSKAGQDSTEIFREVISMAWDEPPPQNDYSIDDLSKVAETLAELENPPVEIVKTMLRIATQIENPENRCTLLIPLARAQNKLGLDPKVNLARASSALRLIRSHEFEQVGYMVSLAVAKWEAGQDPSKLLHKATTVFKKLVDVNGYGDSEDEQDKLFIGFIRTGRPQEAIALESELGSHSTLEFGIELAKFGYFDEALDRVEKITPWLQPELLAAIAIHMSQAGKDPSSIINETLSVLEDSQDRFTHVYADLGVACYIAANHLRSKVAVG